MTATLRAIKKFPYEKFKVPDLTASLKGTGMTWGGNEPVKSGFEKFYNPHIQSILNLPTNWYSYESEYTNVGIPTKFVISSIEDAAKKGMYNTGVNLTTFDLSKGNRTVAVPIAESVRANTMKQIQQPMGGSIDWRNYGENLQICSLRYGAKVPKMIAANPGDSEGIRLTEMETKEMVFIQDIVCEKERGIVFVMLFETPKETYEDKGIEIEETFRIIKTSSYFAFRSEHEKSSKGIEREEGDDGFLFLQL